MSSVRLWAFWRRLYYGTGFLMFWLLVGVGTYFNYLYTPATCFDRVQNSGERGVDCGGPCVRLCAADVSQPTIVWADSFEIVPGQYNAVAYVENSNPVAATPELSYRFEFMSDNVLVAERTGTTILPPDSVYPVFEGRIVADGGLPITETILTLEPAQLWLPASVGRNQFRTRDLELTNAGERPRLRTQIENTELTDARDVEIVATIFDAAGQPLTASQTFVDRLAGRSTQEVVFTWPNSIAKTVRSCEVPSDVLLAVDLSGSMNNDNEDPPQPLTDTLQAAATFIETLNSRDQVGVVTFATEAFVVQPLTRSTEVVAELVTELLIAPEEETGFTNTRAAVDLAYVELNSMRHNDDARRVLVLLTDGLPTEPGIDNPSAMVEQMAAKARADGVIIYVIGLGENVDRGFMESLVEKPEQAFVAPTGADLAFIYEQISTDICEVGPARIDVIPKTETNFAPLR